MSTTKIVHRTIGLTSLLRLVRLCIGKHGLMRKPGIRCLGSRRSELFAFLTFYGELSSMEDRYWVRFESGPRLATGGGKLNNFTLIDPAITSFIYRNPLCIPCPTSTYIAYPSLKHSHSPWISLATWTTSASVRSREMAAPRRRLTQLVRELTPSPASVGTLRLRDITYEVVESLAPSRLPSTSGWKWAQTNGNQDEDRFNTRGSYLLDTSDPVNLDNLYFMLQKYLMGQDMFFVSQPGPYARRLALTFAR